MRSVFSRAAAPLAIAIAVTLTFGVVAQAAHSWSNYHWGRTTNPLTLKIGDNVTAAWDGDLATATSDWSRSSVLDLVPVAGLAKGKNCRPTSGRVEVCNAAYGQNGWLGLAQVWLSGGHIVQGVAKMNDTYFNLPAYNNPSERLHVMCQEIGHTLGLGHTSEDGSSQNTCMDYYRNSADDGISIHPNAHDYEQLEAIYAHLDRTNTAQSGASTAPVWVTGAAPDGTPRGASPSRGRYYIQDLGAGRVVVTHIHWAD